MVGNVAHQQAAGGQQARGIAHRPQGIAAVLERVRHHHHVEGVARAVGRQILGGAGEHAQADARRVRQRRRIRIDAQNVVT
jgi:hypothetical protein